jgi:hypothetical protein
MTVILMRVNAPIVVKLNAFILSVIILNVVILNVVAPPKEFAA